jgi:hypothetical protein
MPKDERLKRGAPLEFNPAKDAPKPPAAGAKPQSSSPGTQQ